MPYYIPEDLAIFNWSLDWRLPATTILLYSSLAAYFSRRNRRLAIVKSSPNAAGHTSSQPWTRFRLAVVAHNLLLTFFSAYTFYAVVPLLLASFRYRPCYDSFCDVGAWAYRHGVGFWTWIFYLSKYYELLDTAILLTKGRPSSFLQTFHHSGAILIMWMLISTRVFSAWVFVVFNSFIHTLMYTYYTLTCLGYQPRWKRLMTFLQIAQFCVGLPLAVAYLSVPGCMAKKPHPKDQLAQLFDLTGGTSQRIALVCSFVYVAALIGLFVNFARHTYYAPSKDAKSKKNL